jgi:hypothetical protein
MSDTLFTFKNITIVQGVNLLVIAMKALYLASEDDLTAHKLHGGVRNHQLTLVRGQSNLTGAVLEISLEQAQSSG